MPRGELDNRNREEQSKKICKEICMRHLQSGTFEQILIN